MAFYSRAVCVLFVLSLASCKQGVDERCQITADCEPGLICEESGGLDSVKICKSESTAEPDAAPMFPVDAPGPDADPTDAEPADADPADAEPADADPADAL